MTPGIEVTTGPLGQGNDNDNSLVKYIFMTRFHIFIFIFNCIGRKQPPRRLNSAQEVSIFGLLVSRPHLAGAARWGVRVKCDLTDGLAPLNPDRGRRPGPELCSIEPADFRQCLPIRLSSSETLKTRDKGESVRLPE